MVKRTDLFNPKSPPELHTGDVLFYSGEDLISKVIRMYTLSEFSHVAIIASVDKDSGTCQVAEALNQGFVVSTRSFEYIYQHYCIARLQNELPRVLRRALRSEIFKLLGTPYGFWTLLKIVIAKMFGKVYTRDPELKKIICSEAVVLVYDRIGFVLTGLPAHISTPADLFRSKHLLLIWKKHN